jgi:hypothetical protein
MKMFCFFKTMLLKIIISCILSNKTHKPYHWSITEVSLALRFWNIYIHKTHTYCFLLKRRKKKEKKKANVSPASQIESVPNKTPSCHILQGMEQKTPI